MKNIQPKTFTLILMGLIAFLTISGIIGFIFATKFITNQKEALRKEKTDLYLAEQRIQQLAELKGKYNKALQRLDDITAAMPSKKQQSEIIVQIKNESSNIPSDSQQAFVVDSIQFAGVATSIQKDKANDPNLTQTTKKGEIYALPITLKASGTFAEIMTYLEKIEKLSRFNSVNSISFVNPHWTNKDRVRQFSIQLNTYLKP